MSSPTIISPIQQPTVEYTATALKETQAANSQSPAYFHLQTHSNLEREFQAISIKRSFTEFEAITWLEMQARFSEKTKTLTKLGTTFFLHKGQFFTTKKWLTMVFNWTDKKVRYHLEKWQKQDLILVIPVKNAKNYAVGSIIHCKRIAQYDPKQALASKEVYLKQPKSRGSKKSQSRALGVNESLDEEGADGSRKGCDSHDSYNCHRTSKDKRTLAPKIIEIDCLVDRVSSKQEVVENQQNLAQFWGSSWGSAFSHSQATDEDSGADVLYKTNINLKNNYKGTDLQNQTIRNQDALIKKLIAEKRDLEQKSNQKVVYFKNLLQKLAKQQVSKEKEREAYDWSFQGLPEFKALEARLSRFGFSKREINGIWWRHVQNSRTDHTPNPAKLALLTDYIDYTELRQKLGKVDDAKKFLLSAISRRFDLSKLTEIREQSKSKEQKLAEALKREEEEQEAWATEREAERAAKEQKQLENQKIEAWIRQNPNHPIYSQCLEAFKQKNQFCYQMLVKKACKQRLDPLELMRLPKVSTTVGLSGIYSEIGGLMGG